MYIKGPCLDADRDVEPDPDPCTLRTDAWLQGWWPVLAQIGAPHSSNAPVLAPGGAVLPVPTACETLAHSGATASLRSSSSLLPLPVLEILPRFPSSACNKPGSPVDSFQRVCLIAPRNPAGRRVILPVVSPSISTLPSCLGILPFPPFLSSSISLLPQKHHQQ